MIWLMISIYMKQGRVTVDIIVNNGKLYCNVKLGVPRYLEYL